MAISNLVTAALSTLPLDQIAADVTKVGGVDYSPYKQKDGETLGDYLARLASIREGGILGTKGLMDTATADTTNSAADTTNTAAGADLGILTRNCPINPKTGLPDCNLKSSGNYEETESQWDRYLKSEERLKGFSFEDYKMQGALDRLTGRAYAGQGLLYGIPHMLSTWSDKGEVKSQLMANGYTEEQAQQMVDNPEFASATNALGRLGTMPTKEYDYKQQNTQDSLWELGTSVIGSIFGFDKQDTGYSRQSPFANPGVVGDGGYYGLPLTANGMTQQILAAQQAALYDPFAEFTLESLTQQAQARAGMLSPLQQTALQAQAELNAQAAANIRSSQQQALAASQAAGLTTTNKGYGFGTDSKGNVGALNASGGVIGTVRDSAGNPVRDSSGNAVGGRNYSPGASDSNASSIGVGSSVSSQGGNASRGFSTGGW